MQVELVSATAVDGLKLDGALQRAEGSASSSPAIDAWLCLHGTGSNFYSATLLAALAPALAQLGGAVLRVNTRGHDLAYYAATHQGRKALGAAFELVDEARWDIAAWLDFLTARGFRRLGVLGHSLGAIKAIYHLAEVRPANVQALVAVSPPRLSHAHFLASSKAEEFRRTYERASELVRTGQERTIMEVTFPLPYLVSAASYLDRYGPDERYCVLNFLDRLPCPALVTYGTREVQSDVAFAGMPDEVTRRAKDDRRLQCAVVEGADHNYTGVQNLLAAEIAAWYAAVPWSASG